MILSFVDRLLVVFLLVCFWLVGSVMAQVPAHPTARRTLSPAFQPQRATKIKVAFLDADSTLRVAPSGKPSANAPDDVAILPLAADGLKRLASEGFLLAIVSNQAGVEAGYITLEIAEQAMALTVKKLADQGAIVHYFDYAESKNEDRKPDIGMGRRLADTVRKQLGKEIDWAQTIMIGDSGWKKEVDQEPDGTPGGDGSNNDRLFAEHLAKEFGGVTFQHPRDAFGWLKQFGLKSFNNYTDLEAFWQKHPEYKPR